MKTMRCQERYFFLLLISLIALVVIFTLREVWLTSYSTRNPFKTEQLHNLPRVMVTENVSVINYKGKCRMYSCFDIFKCNTNKDGKVSVYIYPETMYLTTDKQSIFPTMSNELKEIINTVKSSSMYISDPHEACLFLPSVDILSEVPLNPLMVSAAFPHLDSWDDGQNHIFFNMIANNRDPGKGMLGVDTGKAMVIGADFHHSNFRRKFDISIPVFNTFTNIPDMQEHEIFSRLFHYLTLATVCLRHPRLTYILRRRRRLLTALEAYASMDINIKLGNKLGNKLFLILNECEDVSFPENKILRCSKDTEYNYPEILKASTFCLFIPSLTWDKSVFLDAMMMGCVPVIVLDGSILPFSEVLDWPRASVQIHPNQLDQLPPILKKLTVEEIAEKQLQAFYLWENYLSSLKKITLTTFEIISNRLLNRQAKKYEDWNDVIPVDQAGKSRGPRLFLPPIFFPIQPSSAKGFTAVILTYNRIRMLHTLMERLARCKSLAKIIVVWNNVRTDPPQESFWPKLDKPWVLIRQKTNRLSNRFYPYKEIETEAVLAIDDDILMLTSDEVEFAFRTWLEFHDRLVGFPGRFHLIDSGRSNPHSRQHKTKFRYESEWSNDISMVLTGAAFYHKVYNHYYTYLMPAAVRRYVDEKMNCEDIAMNFLIANVTRKAPIKVTARKRFKCSQCHGNESLWSESSHFVKRSECLSVFTELFGYMPLKSVEFRADPVLFQENVPINLKEFKDIGTI